jgi:tRNA dimethylallyltransferase
MYKDFPIITDQPRTTDLSQCPHVLYGFLETRDQVDAGTFAHLCNQAIAETIEHDRLPILVGGTGLYLRAVIHGLAPIPDISQRTRAVVLKMCRDQGSVSLHKWLQAIDPKAGQRIHCHDKQRITRALEVYIETGHSISWWQEKTLNQGPHYRALQIGIYPDHILFSQRLIARIEDMLKGEALKEVELAWKRCPEENAPGWSAIGCRELLQYHLGRYSLDKAKEEWIRQTKAYAKRQMTWFRKDKDIQWYQAKEYLTVQREIQQWLTDN